MLLVQIFQKASHEVVSITLKKKDSEGVEKPTMHLLTIRPFNADQSTTAGGRFIKVL